MAMMKFIVAASVLASLTSAVPMPGHFDQHVNKRAVEVQTIIHTTWTTVDVTTTVYVNDAEPTPPPQSPAAVESTTTTTPAPEVPAPSPANFAQEPSPAAPSSSAAPVPAPSPEAVNPVPKSTGGPCEGAGSGCSGDITYYNGMGGYGACGSIIDDNTNIVALPVGLMGSQSNGNPYCGRTVTIKGTDGSTHTGIVADKCMGCVGYSIDLTPVLFNAVAPNGDGRVGGIEWYFSS